MSLIANVIDIQRSSVYDGPGIRTTVFFKGCPLHCIWCHNPESQTLAPQLFYYYDKCTACGKCVLACNRNVHRIENGIHSINYHACQLCGKCIEECNAGALKISGYTMSIHEIMDIVLADKDFYEKSNGGITLSGGEPLMQFDFALELLKTCHHHGVNTCIETSGYVSTDKFRQVLAHIDILLFDYKITNALEYTKYTGVCNDRILENLDVAYHSETPIVLRCPIIPGINDTDEHFHGISAMDKKYPDLQAIELLPYHSAGNNKRISIGGEETLTDLKTTSHELAAQWLQRLKDLNCTKAKLEWI